MKRICIVEDDIVYRKTLEDCILLSPEYDIVFSVGSFTEFKMLANTSSRPEIAIVDIHLNGSNGIDILGNIKSQYPNIYIIVITGDIDESNILKAIQNGANSFLYKPFSSIQLYNAFTNIETTGGYLAPETTTKLMQQIRKKTHLPNTNQKLTKTEKKIVELMKLGLSYKEMASNLNISFHTINFHTKNIYRKYDVRSMSELLSKIFTIQ
ncbi:MAG: response regulator transcription factor [Taibaiella sp.]|nr:response regulator transcription factor [Taibaiella sp.]